MALTTTAAVLTATGVTVTNAQVTIAQGIVEDLLGITEESASGNLTARDTRILGRAINYQAAYIAANPDLFGLGDVASVAQPDLSVTFRGDGSGPNLVSPMTRQVLRQFRRSGPRSVAVESWLTNPGPIDEDGDDTEGWTPL